MRFLRLLKFFGAKIAILFRRQTLCIILLIVILITISLFNISYDSDKRFRRQVNSLMAQLKERAKKPIELNDFIRKKVVENTPIVDENQNQPIILQTINPDDFTKKINSPERDKDTQNLFHLNIDNLSNVDGQYFDISSKNMEQLESERQVWSWRCIDGVCKRELIKSHNSILSPEICWLTCGKYGPLWPFPTIQTAIDKNISSFLPQNVKIEFGFAGSHILQMFDELKLLFLNQIKQIYPSFKNESLNVNNNIQITVKVNQPYIKKLNFESPDFERYSLRIFKHSNSNNDDFNGIIVVEIYGETYFGARNGLETLTQLIAYDEHENCLKMPNNVIIEDRPVFAYRGLMVDTARNFIPIEYLKRVIEAMSFNKLNVLHLHFTDTNAFTFHSKTIPQMTQFGAYSKRKFYKPKELIDLVKFANLRGVKLIPEIDAPSHAGNGWQWGVLDGFGDLALCVNQEPWKSFCFQPPCGILNPVNKNTYLVLESIYKDIFEIFDNDIFHQGGDEVDYSCWDHTLDIKKFNTQNNLTLEGLWVFFQKEAYKKLQSASNNKNITSILWGSGLFRFNNIEYFLKSKNYIIQLWDIDSYQATAFLSETNYRVIVSQMDVYLDHGCGTWMGSNQIWAYKYWQKFYDLDLTFNIQDYKMLERIIGGEAPIWTEKIGPENLEPRIWPRMSAFAERLWSNPTERNNFKSPKLYGRMNHNRNRLTKRGIAAEPLQPESCYLLNENCYDYSGQL